MILGTVALYMIMLNIFFTMVLHVAQSNLVKRCVMCGQPMRDFAGYVPEAGEVCMKCYRKYSVENGEK